jgi:plasmid stability protein
MHASQNEEADMCSITVRNLDESVKAGLRLRAASHGWSMEQEVRNILQRAVQSERALVPNFAQLVNRRFRGLGSDQVSVPERQAARDVPTFADV